MKKIIVHGEATLKVNYGVELHMTEEEFNNLSTRQQNRLLEKSIDWYEVSRSAEVDDIDVYELDEVEEDE